MQNKTKQNKTKQNKTKQNKTSEGSRRKILKSMAVGSGAIIAGKSLPDSWGQPVVDSVILPAHAQTSTTTLYAIGDTGPCGGIVFYISNGGLNGLEAAPSDQDGGAGAPWGCQGTTIGGTGTAIGTGAANTSAILGGCGTAGIAARLASNYAGGGCTDWFLPSLDEMFELYLQRVVVGGILNEQYWSSSEDDASFAWVQDLGDSTQVADPKNSSKRVRAIRQF